MKILFTALAVCAGLPLMAQHYYKDIIGSAETSRLLQAYGANKVNAVTIVSFDERNQRNEDFSVEQKFNGRELQTVTRSGPSITSVLVAFVDAQHRVFQTIDSNNLMSTTTQYQYNEEGHLTRVISTSTDSSRRNTQVEERIWQWQQHKPLQLVRIKNKKDSAFVRFKTDEAGNVIEEQETRRGVTGEPVYYYYNDENQLTDIVVYNKKARRLLPESLFEYGNDGRVVQKITVPPGSDNYLIWRFQYNTQGLKTKEVIYNKQKQLTGKVEYQYSFGS